MKQLLRYLSLTILFIFLGVVSVLAQQVVLQDDFEDQNLNQNPEWTGDTGNFTFFDDAGNSVLQLNAPEAGTTQLQTPSTTSYGTWEFYIDQDFAPSDGNRGFIFLISDIEDLSGDVNGYAIRTGENGSDDTFRLFRFTNGTATEILTGQADLSAGGPFQVRVTREEDGTWELFESAGYGTEPVSSGTVVDNNHTTSNYFGLLLNYTATRAENFYFDDFLIENSQEFTATNIEIETATTIDVTFNYQVEESSLDPVDFIVSDGIGSPVSADLQSDAVVRLNFQDSFEDNSYTLTISDVENIYGGVISPNTEIDFTVENPFEVIGFNTENPERIEIVFSEELENTSLNPSNFEVSGAGQPDGVSQTSPGVIELQFSAGLEAGEYTLFLSNIESTNGWDLVGQNEFEFFIFDVFEPGDVVISEFFYRPPADWRPTTTDRPSYIEIYNSTGKIINLRDWTVNGENIESSADLAIEPDEYLVLTKFESVFRDKFGNRNFVEAENFPDFNLTTEDQIVIKTDQNIVVDSLYYRASLWGGNGVALERVENEAPSVYRDNWEESEDSLLGSPGLPNTVTVPVGQPEILDIEFPVPQTMRITFSRALTQESIDELSNFGLNNGVILTSVDYDISDRRLLEFTTDSELENELNYLFNFQNVADIFGNEVELEEYEFIFFNPFRIAAAEVQNGNQLLIRFTQNLEVSTVELSDFQLSDGTSPTNLSFLNSESVLLDFAEDFAIGSHQIESSGFESLIGWAIEDDASASFVVYDVYEPGDILISELMYDEPDGYAKYIEIYNQTDKILNLRDWELRRGEGESSNGGMITEADLTIEPESFVVITSNAQDLQTIFGEGPWVEMSGFPGYTVSTPSTVRLIDQTGEHADSLRYDPGSWGGDGVSLERRSFDVGATFSENWMESPNELMGTPGMPNEVEPDLEAPEFIELNTFQDAGFSLEFSERLDIDSAINPDRYSINPVISVSMVMLNNNEVTLFADTELTDNQVYEVTVEGVSDIFGNEIEPSTMSVQYFNYREAEPQQLVINEILYRRQRSGSPEFIEILNRTGNNIDLTRWTLSDADGSSPLPSGTAIRGDDYLVFTDTESFAGGDDRIIYMSNWPGLSNDGDAIVLKNSEELVIDSLFYQPSWGDNIQGISLERKDDSALSIDPSNWAPSVDDFGSTPVAENSQIEPDENSPEIIFANLFHPDSLELQFNEYVNLNSSNGENQNLEPYERRQIIMQESEHGEPRFLINGSQVDILKYSPLAGNQVILDGSGITAGEEISISIENVLDFQGNIAAEQSQVVAQPVNEGDLVFNEIMFNPLANSSDGFPDQSDYIEIYNRREYAISLEGIFLHEEPDENDEVTRTDFVSTDFKWIPANGHVIIYPESNAINLQQSRTGIFFELDESLEPFALRAEQNTLSLPIGGRQVYLADSARNTIDRIDYSEEWHNPNLISTQGIALERVNPDFDTNDPVNWGSSTSTLGGTPGLENTLFQTTGALPEDEGISLSPNPFSPDDDGFEDNLFINYTLSEPDYLLRIRIYDRYGRLVRNLADGLNAGNSGSVIWDGLNNEGQRNRIGIYIIYVEAYNSANGDRKAFRETAVMARQF